MRSLLLLLAVVATAHSRAVNISNTWVLPEEGFPVFYRYFRDRISWYEADAVCQFHHANLVTVDTTAQYDAVRAYLKELDISSAVWVGLIRSNPEGDFTWTDYRGLSGDGYWSSAPDPRAAPLCAAADPTADYRWEARACGGPTVASFICELPVPQWALGNEGCMIRALPALTILYLPESAAVQLTADCGLAGVKRIQCTGNVKREELLRDLSCSEEVEMSTISYNISLNNGSTSDLYTVTDNQDSSNVITTEENLVIERESDNNQSGKLISTPLNSDQITLKSFMQEIHSTTHPSLNEINKTEMSKNINFDVIQSNNLQSNDIPNLVNNDYTNYREEKTEDDENVQHKKLHDELARLGNFETIFTQPTDHFIPPLVIAKAKLSDDMTVLSLEEKHAQHFGAHYTLKHSDERNSFLNLHTKSMITTEQPNFKKITHFEGDVTGKSVIATDRPKKSIVKNSLPKKYIQNAFDSKSLLVSKTSKGIIKKQLEISTTLGTDTTSFPYSSKSEEIATLRPTTHSFDGIQNDEIIDLTVTLKELTGQNKLMSQLGNETEITNKSEKNYTLRNITELPLINVIINSGVDNNTQPKIENYTQNTVTTNKEDGILNLGVTQSSVGRDTKIHAPNIDLTTNIPVFKDDENTPSYLNNETMASGTYKTNSVITLTTLVDSVIETMQQENSSIGELQPSLLNSSYSMRLSSIATATPILTTEITKSNMETSSVIVATLSNSKNNNSFVRDIYTTNIPSMAMNETINITKIAEDMENNTSDLETIDDYQSPLLSAANEPLQRPNRSRRPKTPQNRINKFNPFRILG